MRLICPNCGAEYQVSDDLIPPGGRDVQCSDCGIAWFQHGADGPALDLPQDLPEDLDEDADPSPPPKRKLPPEVSDILRQEAELETQLRAAESAVGLETQTNLGLDDLPDFVEQPPARPVQRPRAQKAVSDAVRDDRPARQSPRRSTLPDIDEINDTLRSSGDKKANRKPGRQTPRGGSSKRGSSFIRGFSVALFLVAGCVVIYANAPAIARALPQSDPALSAFVALIDQARLWLDLRLRGIFG
ncbi:MAG: zinc-ribbon domain-containing protein [Rhodobacteraceae bacterium]|nr:zinc-ribbon domain-containing protein [Paracoccaceae bacterium]